MSQVFAASGELNNIGSIILESDIQEEIFISEVIEIPEFQIQFQNPSYIGEKDIIKGEYLCDSQKDMCKINTKITGLGGADISNDFGCEIVYSHSFDIDNRCNPTTFIVEKDIQVTYKIFEKNNIENFREKEVIFKRNAKIIEEKVIDNQENTNTGPTDNGETGSGIINENITSTGTGEVNENTSTGSVENISETGSSGIIENNTSTGSEIGENNTSTGNFESNILLLPEIFLEIQSGLEYSGTGDIYNCKKEECKINLDITESFTGSFLEKDYICQWDFGSGSFSVTNTDTKCNPGYVNYGTGLFEISIQIIEKNNSNNFVEKIFFIKNIFNEILTNEIVNNITSTGTGEVNANTSTGSVENISETGSGIIENNTSTGSDVGEETTNTGVIEPNIILLPVIILEIQSGLEYSGTGNIYNCKKEECKINLDISKSFTGSFIEKDYKCEWDFGSGSFSVANTENKCNPGYIEYPLGNHNISVKITDKNNGENYTEKSIRIENKKIEIIENISTKSSGGGSSSSSSSSSYSSISIKNIIDVSINKKIEVQSGLNNQNICNEKLCKINIKYDNSSYEICKWIFDGIEVKENYKTSCNPGFIYYPSGKYNIKLQVNNSKINSIHNKILRINNIYNIQENINTEKLEGNIKKNGENNIEGNYIGEKENDIKNINFKIELQGKKVQYKKYIGDRIICFGVDKCSVNLKTKNSTKYMYYWDFGNGELSTKSNPKSVWYNSGSYIINLTIKEENSIIFMKNISVEVVTKIISEKQKIIAKEFITAEEKQKFLSFDTQKFYKKGFLSSESFSEIISEKNRENIFKNLEKKGLNIKKDIIKNTEVLLELKQDISWFKRDDYTPKLRLTRSVLQQNKGLKFTGKTLPNATIFISSGDNILEIQADNLGKYVIQKRDVIPGKYALEYYVLDEKGNFFQAKTVKNIELSEKYIKKVQQTLSKKKTKNNIIKKKHKKGKRVIKKEGLYTKKSGSNNNFDKFGGGDDVYIKNSGVGQNIFLIFLSMLSFLGSIVLLKKYKIL